MEAVCDRRRSYRGPLTPLTEVHLDRRKLLDNSIERTSRDRRRTGRLKCTHAPELCSPNHTVPTRDSTYCIFRRKYGHSRPMIASFARGMTADMSKSGSSSTANICIKSPRLGDPVCFCSDYCAIYCRFRDAFIVDMHPTRRYA